MVRARRGDVDEGVVCGEEEEERESTTLQKAEGKSVHRCRGKAEQRRRCCQIKARCPTNVPCSIQKNERDACHKPFHTPRIYLIARTERSSYETRLGSSPCLDPELPSSEPIKLRRNCSRPTQPVPRAATSQRPSIVAPRISIAVVVSASPARAYMLCAHVVAMVEPRGATPAEGLADATWSLRSIQHPARCASGSRTLALPSHLQR